MAKEISDNNPNHEPPQAIADCASACPGPCERVEEELFRLASAVEQAGEAFVILDEHLVIRYVNQAFETMTGYCCSEAKGKPLKMLYGRLEQAKTLQQIRNTLGQGETWFGRLETIRKDGAEFRCEKTISVIRGRGGAILGFVEVWRDVTELELMEKQLRQAQKLELLATMAGGIAHDFNNVLSLIILHGQMGAARYPEDDPSRYSFDQILRAAERAQNLVEKLLNLGRRNTPANPVPLRLSTLIREGLKLLLPSIPPVVRIDLDIEMEDDFLLADPVQVHQIIMNLLTNAIQAMHDRGGVLGVALRKRGLDKSSKILCPLAKTSDFLELVVSDTGHGIAADVVDRIFDPFFTTKHGKFGTGLGLSVVHHVVTGLGGAITVESQTGKGAVFTVLLPRFDNPGTHDAVGGESTDSEEASILFADTDAPGAGAVVDALRRLGHRVETCLGQMNALRHFVSDPGGFDLAVIDMALLENEGVGFTRELLSRRPCLPILIVSDGQEHVSPAHMQALGAREILRRPLRDNELDAAVKRALQPEKGRG